MRRRPVLLTVSLIATLSAWSCRPKTVEVVSEGTAIHINLAFPLNALTGSAEDFTTVCGDAQSYLVSLDLDSAGTATWDYRFLFSTDGALFGCGTNQPCAHQQIDKDLGSPKRVLLEGIDVTPAAYMSGPTSNVVCRGLADVSMPTGTIVTIPRPAASPTPGPHVSSDVDVSIQMLRIGDVNGVFGTDGPKSIAYSGAASSLWPQPPARTATGGIVVFGGGLAPSALSGIFEFDPRAIAFGTSAASFSFPRQQESATPFLDAGQPAILFAGGTTTGPVLNNAEIYRHGSPTTVVVPTFIGQPLEAHAAIQVTSHRDLNGNPSPVIAILGGCQGATFSAQFEYFFPHIPADGSISNCVGGSVVGQPGFCRPIATTAVGDGGHCAMLSGLISDASQSRIVTGMGYTNTGLNDHVYEFNPELESFVLMTSSAIGTGIPSTANVSDSTLAAFGGYTAAGPASDRWLYLQLNKNTLMVGSGVLKAKRAGCTATRLYDGRIALIGGYLERSVELFTPNVGTTSGAFAFASRSAPDGSCTNGFGAACAVLAAVRQAQEFTGTRIEGTSNWLNGSILVEGGGSTTRPELFVPAYQCNGTIPISPTDGQAITELDFCDRLRALEPITNPQNVTRLP